MDRERGEFFRALMVKIQVVDIAPSEVAHKTLEPATIHHGLGFVVVSTGLGGKFSSVFGTEPRLPLPRVSHD